MSTVAVCIPTYNFLLNERTMKSLLFRASKKYTLSPIAVSSSSAWILQLNAFLVHARKISKMGITYFLYLHHDVSPATDNWIDILISELDKTGAHMIAPLIMSDLGTHNTSTFIETEDKWHPKELSLFEFPEDSTSLDKKYLPNSGCLLINLKRSARWLNQIHWRSEEIIENGKDLYEKEDWAFSRDARKHGAIIAVTNKVKTEFWTMGGACT